MSVIIAPATTTDIDALVELLSELFAIEQDFTPDAEAQRRGLRLLIDAPDRAAVFVARNGEPRILGMVTAQLVISTAIGAPSAWIEDMIVRDGHRGQGIGRALLDQATHWAAQRGAGRVQLLVDADNAPALAYYQRLNWQATRLLAWRKGVTATHATDGLTV